MPRHHAHHAHHPHRNHHHHHNHAAFAAAGEPSCCAVVVDVPAVNCGNSYCLRDHRHTLDYNVGHFLKQLQAQYLGRYQQYPVVVFHIDLETYQQHSLRSKTLSPVLFHKINLNPMAMPLNLRPLFPAIVNATKAAHPLDNLFLPEHGRTLQRGFQQRMLSRFFLGEMLLRHTALDGYKFVMRFDAVDVRLPSQFPYDPFTRVRELKAVYAYHDARLVDPAPIGLSNFLMSWTREHAYSWKLLKPFVTTLDKMTLHNGRSYSRAVEVFRLDAFRRSELYKQLFDAVDNSGLFLLSEVDDRCLTDGQFLSVAVAFLAARNPAAVAQLIDVPIQYPVDPDEVYK